MTVGNIVGVADGIREGSDEGSRDEGLAVLGATEGTLVDGYVGA